MTIVNYVQLHEQTEGSSIVQDIEEGGVAKSGPTYLVIFPRLAVELRIETVIPSLGTFYIETPLVLVGVSSKHW